VWIYREKTRAIRRSAPNCPLAVTFYTLTDKSHSTERERNWGRTRKNTKKTERYKSFKYIKTKKERYERNSRCRVRNKLIKIGSKEKY
jgi:hypothetical protein